MVFSHAQQTGSVLTGCTATLPTSSGISSADVAMALRAPGVDEAFSEGLLFGRDSRPCDGTLLTITYGARRILVGDDCLVAACEETTCRPAPPNIAKLVDLLRRIDTEALATCH